MVGAGQEVPQRCRSGICRPGRALQAHFLSWLRSAKDYGVAPAFGRLDRSWKDTKPTRRSDEAPTRGHLLRSCGRLLRIWSSRASSGSEHCSRPLAASRNRPAKRHQEGSCGVGDCMVSLTWQGDKGAQLWPAGLRCGHLQGPVTLLRRVPASIQLRSCQLPRSHQ